ncbi:Thymidylate kinase [Dehalobacter sp. UNSWDHB]|uniref:dTMP kinase n=1 Tax=unclassified Dehalobacter TaxID=2635733 RepID=UPI00028AABB1|nr:MULTISPECIES: dTMP kinase [unclassified Dehalobacter]AFV01851.1 Thymidylate kinase [Dehalobacter sp. DCA]AFV04888.1 Thymidylate kinase [Dehalobacter sp. CF]EQB20692.1 Thymidylate kinase [Dehalobacter sp. UNSWDHB]
MQVKGKFIVLEGIDGSGKGTQIERLKVYLETVRGVKTVLTREPSQGPLGTTIRQVLSGRINGVNDNCLALLFAADRLDHNNNLVIPALEQGNYVICDRYLWSSFAYQGMKNDESWIGEINQYAVKPDLTLFIKVSPETSLKRIAAGRFQTEIFENSEMLRHVADNYQKLYKQWQKNGEPVVEINGEKEPELVQQDIVAAFRLYFPE